MAKMLLVSKSACQCGPGSPEARFTRTRRERTTEHTIQQIPSLISLPLLHRPPLLPLSLPLQQPLQLLSIIEYSPGPLPTRRTARLFSIPVQRTRLAEIMPTPRHHRTLIIPLTDHTLERDILQHRLFVFLLILLVSFHPAPFQIGVRDDGSLDVLALCDGLPFAIQLPALFVVASFVQEFAGVA